MSQENVKIVRALFDAWNAGDWDVFRELYDPDVIVRPAEGWPEPGPFVGPEAATRWFGQLRETWDAQTIEPISDFIDAGDRVVARQTWRGVGHGPDSNIEFTAIYTLRKGRVVFVELFWHYAEALEAVGLSEQAMSEENVEIVRRIYGAWNAGDPGFDFYAPDIEWDVSRYAPDLPNVAQGHEQVRTLFRRYIGIWEELHFELKRITAARPDTVIAEVIVHSRGRGSGVPVADRVAHVFTLCDGLVMRHVQYRSNAEALEAVGLSE